MEAEVTQLKAEGHQGLVTAPDAEGPRTGSPLEPSGKHGPSDTWILDFQPPELRDNTFLSF